MRKLGIVLLALGILLLGAAICSAKTIYVKSTYVPDSTHATTITGGLALCVSTTTSAPDTIYVAPGTYNEAVTVSKNVIIQSTGGRLVTIVTAPTATDIIFTVGFGVNNVAIKGFTIFGATNGVGVGIGLLGADNVRVKNCLFVKNAIGIDVVSGFLAQADNVVIDSNTIRYSTIVNGGTNQGTGILVEGYSANVTNVVITNNQIVDNDGAGIYVYGGSGTPSFNGMRIGSNTLVNNYALDFGLPNNHNWNLGAMAFGNAAGTITLNNNKIQQTNLLPPFYVTGGTATFTGTGNATYNNCNKSVGGTATPLATP